MLQGIITTELQKIEHQLSVVLSENDISIPHNEKLTDQNTSTLVPHLMKQQIIPTLKLNEDFVFFEIARGHSRKKKF